ncbi:MAG: methyltransferase domain-containing protein [Chitinispirillaceae bacterium]|nr:methyltransferase domain-containing protein [Chitinispirillaceae bacterium]
MQWSAKDIIRYYKTNEFAYNVWGRNMHYGYWEPGIRTQRQASLRFNEVMAAIAHIGRNDRVLDAGCGVGGASIYLAKKFGCRATGITICPRQVEKARKNARAEGVDHLTEFYEMDYEHTTFQDGRFDVVWGLESICYAKSKKQFVEEASRVTGGHGRLIVGDGFASRETYSDKDKKLLHRWLDGWIVTFLDTPAAFMRYAAAAGYRKYEYEDVTSKVMPTSRLMFVASLPFFPFHIVDKIHRLKSYPTDGMFNQYLSLRRKLWQYGIFYAEK